MPIAGYGTWRSPITPEVVTRGQVGLAEPSLDRGTAYWLESRPDEGGRTVLVGWGTNGVPRDLVEQPFNVRTRVHEYGGGAYAARDGVIVAVNDADQRVWRIDGGPGRALTPESDRRLRFADFELDPVHGRAFAVREDHRGAGEPANTIVALDLNTPGEGRVLAGRHDFVSSPRLSPDGTKLAWLAWNHPNMPWDGTELWLAGITSGGQLADPRRVAGGPTESVVQPVWSPDGHLYFVSDRTGWWNIHRLTEGGALQVCRMSAEFAGPAWVFGARWYAFLGSDAILACYTRNGSWQLGRIEVGSGRLSPWDLPYTEVSGPMVEDGRAILRTGAPDRSSAIVILDPVTGQTQELRTAGVLPVDACYLARPLSLEFPTTAGDRAYAFYYPPTNSDFSAPQGELPPLVVKSHGGPTGAASSELKLSTQFWTSRGFALCDVNYGGSTGFGRPYRERLLGNWGVVDVADCLSAARHLVADKKADPARLAITGGSAGGYTTLCALTFHDLFKAGASHYGVSDLEALAHETHKFESRYLDRLIGPWPEAQELYRTRSPIQHVERLSCPIIFFQGLEDAVVPPNQAEMMVDALRGKGLPVAYLTFAGEQHGFRRAETIQNVLAAELAFYGRVFGFAAADGLADLVIENL